MLGQDVQGCVLVGVQREPTRNTTEPRLAFSRSFVYSSTIGTSLRGVSWIYKFYETSSLVGLLLAPSDECSQTQAKHFPIESTLVFALLGHAFDVEVLEEDGFKLRGQTVRGLLDELLTDVTLSLERSLQSLAILEAIVTSFDLSRDLSLVPFASVFELLQSFFGSKAPHCETLSVGNGQRFDHAKIDATDGVFMLNWLVILIFVHYSENTGVPLACIQADGNILDATFETNLASELQPATLTYLNLVGFNLVSHLNTERFLMAFLVELRSAEAVFVIVGESSMKINPRLLQSCSIDFLQPLVGLFQLRFSLDLLPSKVLRTTFCLVPIVFLQSLSEVTVVDETTTSYRLSKEDLLFGRWVQSDFGCQMEIRHCPEP